MCAKGELRSQRVLYGAHKVLWTSTTATLQRQTGKAMHHINFQKYLFATNTTYISFSASQNLSQKHVDLDLDLDL